MDREGLVSRGDGRPDGAAQPLNSSRVIENCTFRDFLNNSTRWRNACCASPPEHLGSRRVQFKRSLYGDLYAQGADSVAFYTRKKVITEHWFGAEGPKDGWL